MNDRVYNNYSFFRIDDDGRIIDNLTNQAIGICNEKKKEILDDYNTLSDENLELKSKLDDIYRTIEQYKDSLPEELIKYIEKPPTVESLKNELSEIKNMLAMVLQNKGGEPVDNIGNVPKTGANSSNTKRGGNKTEISGDQSE